MKNYVYKGIPLPTNIREEAKEYVQQVIDTLDHEDKLNKLDMGAFYMLAGTYNTYLNCKDLEIEKGITTISPQSGIENIAPWCQLAKSSSTTIIRILQELGLTIRARKSLKVMDSDGGADESPLQKFIKSNESLS